MKTKLLLFSALLAVFFSTSCNEAKPVLHTSPNFLAVVDSLCIENEYVDEPGYSPEGVSSDFDSYISESKDNVLSIFKDLPMELVSSYYDPYSHIYKATLMYDFKEEDDKYSRIYGLTVEITNYLAQSDEPDSYIKGKKYYVTPEGMTRYREDVTEILGIQKSDEPKTRKTQKQKKIADFRMFATIKLIDAKLSPAE